jgi:ectoine hydroxylase-related dioxygenase (phytanoyl-CoA dioxygenase family)
MPALAAAGSLIVFDAMVFHRGGVNRGAGPRRAVNTVFGVPLLAQQVAFTAKPGMDARLRRRLGLDYQPAASADAWREMRAARLGGGAA